MSGAPPPAAFYCVTSSLYFLGAVGMINSLRMVGHREPIYVLDCGLSAKQRQLLSTEATVLPAPDETPPYLLKTVIPLAHPAEVLVMIDADMIATRSLSGLIEIAREGKVVAFENLDDRFVPEWGEILDLGPIEPRRYLCSGFVALGRDPGEEILRIVDDRQRDANFERNCFNVNLLTDSLGDSPLVYLDQDVLNAVLAARVPADRVVGLDARLTALTPFEGLHQVEQGGLECVYEDGRRPYLLHHIFPGKPWLQPMPEGLYTDLLRRLLVGPGIAIRVPEGDVPARLRFGARAEIVRRGEQALLRSRLALGPYYGRARGLVRRVARHREPAG